MIYIKEPASIIGMMKKFSKTIIGDQMMVIMLANPVLVLQFVRMTCWQLACKNWILAQVGLAPLEK